MKNGSLSSYRDKRDFSVTPEPKGKAGRARKSNLDFLVQKHDASHLHYDFRLEWQGVLLSWAVPKGPSTDPAQKRLAVRTEDHPLSYGDFEGTIPKEEYGGGTVMLWDRGTWQPENDPGQGLEEGKLHFTLQGERMKGGWALVRLRKGSGGNKQNWLLIKEKDEFASRKAEALIRSFDTSVKTGRTMASIAQGNSGADKRSSGSGKRKSATAKKKRKDAGKDGNKRGKEARQPGFRKPQLTRLVDKAPEGDDWLHETKFDGYRCLVSLGRNGARLFTRSGLDWSDRFADLKTAVEALPCDSALLDGEVVARKGGELSGFSALQKALKTGGALVYYVFDLLALDGRDLRSLPLVERKKKLEQLLHDIDQHGGIRYTEHVRGGGPQVLAHICRAGGEGIIAKRVDAKYRGTRNRDWLKIKCTRRQEFVIGGYSPSDKKSRAFASILLGVYGEGGFHYRGRVGAGFSETDLEELARAFKRRTRKTSPFVDVPTDIAAGARWVTPELVVEIDFTEFTADGYIRHGVYRGRREDKMARDVSAETPEATNGDADDKQEVASIRISHASREVFPEAGLSKLELARYYAKAGDRIMAIASRRPLSLVRCPKGIGDSCFYQKHAGKGFPDEVKVIRISEKQGGSGEYLYMVAVKGLVAAVQMGVIEFHMWGATIDAVEKPDRLVFDLDPDEGLDFDTVRQAAELLRQLLQELGLASIPVLTGGKGVHVCVPLRRTLSWHTLKTFAKTLATMVADEQPRDFTATMSKDKRKGRIFIDWLRNERGSTAIVPYSVRARTGAPVAVPVSWQELGKMQSARAFTVTDMKDRLSRPCPYLAALDNLQTIGKAVIRRLEHRAGAGR